MSGMAERHAGQHYQHTRLHNNIIMALRFSICIIPPLILFFSSSSSTFLGFFQFSFMNRYLAVGVPLMILPQLFPFYIMSTIDFRNRSHDKFTPYHNLIYSRLQRFMEIYLDCESAAVISARHTPSESKYKWTWPRLET